MTPQERQKLREYARQSVEESMARRVLEEQELAELEDRLTQQLQANPEAAYEQAMGKPARQQPNPKTSTK